VTPQQALEAKQAAARADELQDFLAPYLDRMETAHKNTLNDIVMKDPSASAKIVAQAQAVRSFAILRGMIEMTIAEGREAEGYLRQVAKFSDMSDVKKKFLGITIP
jgi:hypothetical protein